MSAEAWSLLRMAAPWWGREAPGLWHKLVPGPLRWRQGTKAPGPASAPADCSHRLVSRPGNGDVKEKPNVPGTFPGQQREELSGPLQGSLRPTGDAVPGV